MGILNTILLEIINEQNLPILKTTGNKPIANAIKNRNKITFYYSGPRKPKKDSVKAGYRIKVEPVALGLSKKGKLILRAWVDVPSTTKTGFGKGHWRTFMLGRTNNVQVTDEVFNEKRPGYNEEGDGSMSVVYVKTDWNKPVKPKPEPISKQKEPEITKVAPKKEPQKTEPQKQELPQPKPIEKPEKEPTQPTQDVDKEYQDKQKELYNLKRDEWINKQKEIGGNIKPGQGTRERFRKEVEKELPQPKPEEKPLPNPEEEPKDETDNQLQESIRRIKSLMFS